MIGPKYEKPLKLDMPFEEALQRYAGSNPKESRATMAPAVPSVLELVVFKVEDIEEECLVDPESETVWAQQSQIAAIYGRDSDTIGEHIQNIYADGELDREATTGKFPVVRQEGARSVKRLIEHYNLDMILSVGFRTHSKRAVKFRQWANRVLKSFIVDGYALNEARLRDDPRSLHNLAADVRALRSGEKQIYEAVRECFKISSSDYEPNSQHTKSFYAKLQDKFLVATTGKTASQLILDRADSAKDAMGLTNMKGEFPTLWDAKVGKNYLVSDELYALHILCEQFLLFAESKALRGQKLSMSGMAAKFDELLAVQGHTVFSEYKDYLEKRAHDHALRELEAYKKRIGYVPKPRAQQKLEKNG